MKHIKAFVPIERDLELDLVLGSAGRNKSKVWLVLSNFLPLYVK